MSNVAHRHQIVPAKNEDGAKSGVYERTSPTAATVRSMKAAVAPAAVAPVPAPPPMVRQIAVEHLGPGPKSRANDLETSYLINTGDHCATSYRFVAPRQGRKGA
jgi:hypothetical protein